MIIPSKEICVPIVKICKGCQLLWELQIKGKFTKVIFSTTREDKKKDTYVFTAEQQLINFDVYYGYDKTGRCAHVDDTLVCQGCGYKSSESIFKWYEQAGEILAQIVKILKIVEKEKSENEIQIILLFVPNTSLIKLDL